MTEQNGSGQGHLAELNEPSTRRRFLRTLGIGGSLAMVPAVLACEDDDDGIVDINDDPTAVFSFSPGNPGAGEQVTFDASSSSDLDDDDLTFAWDFGDGGQGSGMTVTHTFESMGTYNVMITVTDDGGGMDTATVTLNVGVASVTLDLSTDVGILNFAYALEQLEAAFYSQVVASFYAGATDDERRVLTDLRDHEVAHRELYAAALGDAAIPGLTPNFDAIDFTSRTSVLATARTFEDLGVAAYNGAGAGLTNPDFLVVAGKIVSVEARHASVIRTLLGRSFAPEAFDDAMEPQAVLNAASPFIENQITLQNA